MVDIEVKDGQVSFRPRGLSKLWTMRNQITVPRSAIRSVRRAPPGVGTGWWKGWRLPGTHLPGHSDALFSIWRLSWIAHAMARDPSHLFDANIFYPHTRTLA